MSLEKKINERIKESMLARDKRTLEALRAVKSAILLAKTEKGAGDELSETAELQLLQRLVKQRKESADVYESKGRTDLAEEERFQMQVIEGFLPQQLSEDEVRKEVAAIIEETGAESMKDMGRVMSVATKKLAGKADNKIISVIVREHLA